MKDQSWDHPHVTVSSAFMVILSKLKIVGPDEVPWENSWYHKLMEKEGLL